MIYNYYNAPIKWRFIDELTQSSEKSAQSALSEYAYYKNLFLKSYDYENEAHKDLGEFTRDEVLNYLLTNQNVKVRSVYNYGLKIKKYINWYRENIKQEDPVIWKISMKDVEEALNVETLYGEEDLVQSDELFSKDFIDELASLQINSVQKMMVYGLYHGISGKYWSELSTLNKESIVAPNSIQLREWDNGSLQVVRKIKAPDYLMYYLKESCDEMEYYTPNPWKPDEVSSTLTLYGPWALKSTKKDEVRNWDQITEKWLIDRKKIIRSRLQKMILPKDFKGTCTPTKLWTSGIVNTIKSNARIRQVSPMKFFEDQRIYQVLEQYGKTPDSIHQVKYSLRKYLEK